MRVGGVLLEQLALGLVATHCGGWKWPTGKEGKSAVLRGRLKKPRAKGELSPREGPKLNAR